MPRRTLLFALMLLVVCRSAIGADGLIELIAEGKTFQGKQIAHDQHTCFLADREGRLIEVSLDKVTAFRSVEPAFRPIPAAELRDRLKQELGPDYEVVAQGHYVVCAPRGRSVAYAKILNEAHHRFHEYFRVRKFELKPVDFPLVTVVYPTRELFFDQCRTDNVPVADSLRGYYLATNNRIAFFDEESPNPVQVATSSPLKKSTTAAAAGKKKPGISPLPTAHSHALSKGDPLTGLSRDTTVHEAIHQLAYNTGLHARVGQTPLWVVEGLAMQFENGGNDKSKSDINLSRLQNFQDYRPSRAAGALTDLVSSNKLFTKLPVETYSDAWMLTYYLIQTRPAKFQEYLKTLAFRAPVEYDAETRVSDFKLAFGEDLAWFEVEYLRFADDTIAEHLPEPKKPARR